MTKKDQRQREWMTHIADYKASGLTMAAWCTANHVTLEQLKYWTRKLKKIASIDAAPEAARFIPVSVAESSPQLRFARRSCWVRQHHASKRL